MIFETGMADNGDQIAWSRELWYVAPMETIYNISCTNCDPRRHSVFCLLKDEQLNYLKKHKISYQLHKQDMIFREREQPRGLYCLFSGLVKIYKVSEDGKEQIVRLAKSGDIIGYRAFFSGEKYMASAQALNDIVVCFIDRAGIEKLIIQSPEMIFNLLKKVCVELREAEEKFQSLMEKSVEARLANFLSLFLSESGHKKVHVPLSREEIASLIGARSETVIRVLSGWKSQGIIRTKAKSITFLKQLPQ